MNKKLIELNNKLVDLQAQTEKVLKEIERVKREETWPNMDDEYFVIDTDGDVFMSIWSDLSTMCATRKDIGNVFKTKADARFELNKRMVIAKLKKYALSRTDVESNRYEGERYYMYLSGKNEIKIKRAIGFVHSTLYFESPEKTKEAIAAVSEKSIKKYYFEIEE